MPDSEDYRIANMALGRLGIGRVTDFTDTSEVATILNVQYEDWKKELLQDHPWKFASRRRRPGHFQFTSTEVNTVTNAITPTAGHDFFENEGPFEIELVDSATIPTGLAVDTEYYLHTVVAETSFKLTDSDDGESALNISTAGSGTFDFVKTPGIDWSYAHYLPSDFVRMNHVEEREDNYEWEIEGDYVYHNVGTTIWINYVYDMTMSRVNFPLFKRALALKIAVDLAESGVKTTSVLQEIRDDYLMALQRAKSVDGQQGSPTPTINGSWADEMGRIS